MEDRSARVGESPRQAGETRGAYPGAEPRVWTQRMLEALDNGVKGGVWFSLIDKVWAPRTLEAAW